MFTLTDVWDHGCSLAQVSVPWGIRDLGGESTVDGGEKSSEIMERGQMGARAVCSAFMVGTGGWNTYSY